MNLHIKKIGHCCLVIDDGETRILTDPGNTTSGYLSVRGVQAVIITHKHADHLDPETIKKVAENNPEAIFIANGDAGAVLSEYGIESEEVEAGEERAVGTITVRAHTAKHEFIHSGIPLPENTGYLIGENLYLPGDSLVPPPFEVKTLALPVSAPWETIHGALEFSKAVKPRHVFPIHDGMLAIHGPFHRLPSEVLPEEGISFTALKPDEEIDI